MRHTSPVLWVESIAIHDEIRAGEAEAMTRRQISIVIVLLLFNYLIFTSLIRFIIEESKPAPTPTRTPKPTFTMGPAMAQVTAPPPTPTPMQPTPTNTLVVPPTSTPRTGRVTHVVQPGETLESIAAKYDSPVEDIAHLNGITDPNNIKVGQELIIPAPGEVVPTITPTRKPRPPTKPPPTNTPAPPPEPPTPVCAYQFCPGAWYPGARNEGLTRFYGYIKDTAENPVNGFFVRMTCGSYRVLSYPSGPSSVAPNAAPGFWDITVRSEPLTLDCSLQIVMYKCGEWFNAQCDQFDPLSEDVHVHTDREAGETIIVADWICHHDCDKGLRR
jgi:LysM repeat protein